MVYIATALRSPLLLIVPEGIEILRAYRLFSRHNSFNRTRRN